MRLLSVLIACTLFVPGAWGLEPDDPAFIGVWLFDEGEGDTVGDLINGNDGTINSIGFEFEWQEGKFGGALAAVDGTGSVQLRTSPSLESIEEEITMAGWFRIDADSDTGIRNQTGFLLEDQSGSEPVPDGWSFRLWTDGGNLSPGIYGQTELDQGEWYHVAGTYDGELMELYINGEPESALGLLDASGAEIDGDWSGLVDLGTILELKYGAESFTGAMDEMAILSRALSQDEIKQLMNGWANLGGADDPLQAGDADMDCDFDQLDLVLVQQGGKYLTEQDATWSDGDWNGAPGGSVADQDPPPGDGRFNQLDIIAALGTDLYLQGSYCADAGMAALAGPAPPSPEGETDEQASIVYNAETGEVSVNAPASTELTSVNIDSASGIFVNFANAQNLDGSFDTGSEDNIFKATFGDSFGNTSFGAIATAGLSEEDVLADLTVIGSLNGGGGLGDVDLIYVPEPSSIVLLGLGLAAIILTRRRR